MAENPLLKWAKSLKQKQPTVPYLEDVSPQGFFSKWISSPEYQKRTGRTGYGPEIVPNRLAALANLDVTRGKGKSISSAPPTPGSKASVFLGDEAKDNPSVLPHEMSHAIGAVEGWKNNNVGMSKEEDFIIKSSIIKQQPKVVGSQGSEERKRSEKEFSTWKHLNQPKEIKADLDATRHQMFQKGIYDLTGGKEFTKEDLKKAKKELGGDESFKRLIEQVGEDNYIKLMNTIAMGKPQSRFSQMFA